MRKTWLTMTFTRTFVTCSKRDPEVGRVAWWLDKVIQALSIFPFCHPKHLTMLSTHDPNVCWAPTTSFLTAPSNQEGNWQTKGPVTWWSSFIPFPKTFLPLPTHSTPTTFTFYWPELGHLLTPKPLPGKQVVHHNWLRPIPSHHPEFSTLLLVYNQCSLIMI